MTDQKQNYAILIGIDHYPQLSTPTDVFATHSAASFAEWLHAPEGGGLENDKITIVTSPPALPADPSDARPTQQDIDDALLQLLTNAGKAGGRLYFYFAGQASGSLNDDVILMMANASPVRAGAISLRSYRQLLSRYFDEIIYILDCAFVPGTAPIAPPGPSIATPIEPQRTSAKEFILMTSNRGVHEQDSSSQGLLTKVVLEGLRGGAAAGATAAPNEQDSPERQITAVSLSDYVRARIRDLTTGPKLKQMPEMLLPTERIEFSTVSVSFLKGTLIVEVPHWTAEVRICNSLMQLVAGPLELKKTSKKTAKNGDVYAGEVKLAEGIYRIEVTLEGKRESQLAVVEFNQKATIENESWKDLGFVSAAPLEGTASTHEWHMGPAVQFSRQITWPNSPGGDKRTSTLYLFVRTSYPKKYPRFADGLRLLDAAGELVTDFSDGAKKDKSDGWFAFRADLQPGYYILRRGRAGVRLRQQPIYLCDNWETHIFLEASTTPSLRSQSVNMAPRGAGFQPNDETALAAEAVLDAIRYGGSIKHLVSHDNLSLLLRDKIANPWLAVLAAYALRSQLNGHPDQDTDTKELLDHVMRFLDSKIGNHPDVRALKLDPTKPASEPFLYPPLLIKGLRLVEQHSFKFKRTVPEGSLTDLVLDALVVNSPWTAWRQLAEEPSTSSVTDTTADAVAADESVMDEPALSLAATALQATSAKAPTFRMADVVGTPRKSRRKTSAHKGRVSSVSVSSFQDAQLLSAVQNLTNLRDLDAIPDTYTYNQTKQATELLDNINPTAISQAAGISLAQTEGSLQRLRNLVTTDASGGGSSNWEAELSPAEKVSLEYALAESAKPADTTANEGVVIPHPSVSLEDCVTAIRGEALRLLVPPEDEQQPTADVQAASNIGRRLLDVANALLDRAAFTVTTDSHHKILYCNRAFISLITSVDMKLNEKEREAKKKSNYKLWESILKSIPIGSSVLTNPIAGSTPAVFSVRRTQIKAEGTDRSKAYLNTLKGKDSASVTSTMLEEVSEILPDLTRQASFYWYDSSGRSAYTAKLENLTQQLESKIGVTTHDSQK